MAEPPCTCGHALAEHNGPNRECSRCDCTAYEAEHESTQPRQTLTALAGHQQEPLY
jgi:hypothetical protein